MLMLFGCGKEKMCSVVLLMLLSGSSFARENYETFERVERANPVVELTTREGMSEPIDVTTYVGSYHLHGIEGGLMMGVPLMKVSQSTDYYTGLVSAEVGLHRANWTYQEIKYNRFAATGDLRLDLRNSTDWTPYAAAGYGVRREWFDGAEKAVSRNTVNTRVGVFYGLSESFALRFEYAGNFTSVRLGATLKL